MHSSYTFNVIRCSVLLLPYNLRYKILLPKYLIHHQAEVMNFVVIDRNEDNAVLAEQVACQKEAWIHHVQPVAVLVPAGIGAQAVIPHNVTLIIGDTCLCLVATACLLEVIAVDKIIASVVGRVDIDHLDLAIIRLVQNLQRRQIITLDKHIARCIPIDGIRSFGVERLDSLLLDGSENVALALPAKPIALTQIYRLTQSRLELLPVDLAFGDYLGEELLEFVNLLLVYVIVVAIHAAV